MDPLLEHLKSVIEGVPGLERWQQWFERNDAGLQKLLTRTRYLDVKLNRIKAIPRILESFGIQFVRSTYYDYIAGGTGRCRDCGAIIQRGPNFATHGGFFWCPNGCFKGHAMRSIIRR